MGTSNFMGSVKAETIKGTEPGSVYTVIAKSDGLTLGFRPIVFPKPCDEHKRMIMYVGARLRVVVNSPDGALEIADQVFGIKGFTEKKGKHASTMVGSKVISLPASVAQINGVLKDSNRIAHFVETLWGLVANATGKEPLVSILQLQTYMEEELLNVMPDMEDLIFDEMVLEYCL
jgi:hypothetical protein